MCAGEHACLVVVKPGWLLEQAQELLYHCHHSLARLEPCSCQSTHLGNAKGRPCQ